MDVAPSGEAQRDTHTRTDHVVCPRSTDSGIGQQQQIFFRGDDATVVAVVAVVDALAAAAAAAPSSPPVDF